MSHCAFIHEMLFSSISINIHSFREDLFFLFIYFNELYFQIYLTCCIQHPLLFTANIYKWSLTTLKSIYSKWNTRGLWKRARPKVRSRDRESEREKALIVESRSGGWGSRNYDIRSVLHFPRRLIVPCNYRASWCTANDALPNNFLSSYTIVRDG